MRAIGLLLLIAVHVDPPQWFVPLRSFDVPLMVFVSSMCYKPLGGGYLAYIWKRVKRIYIPVFVFLTIFFVVVPLCPVFMEEINLDINKIVGSYLLLNRPSIGYVWIMRVFIMMAVVIPLYYRYFSMRKISFLLVISYLSIAVQFFLIMITNKIDNCFIHFIVEETILYVVGYSPVALLGLAARTMNKRAIWLLLLMTGCMIIGFVVLNGGHFVPQNYKYPPSSLYILYGIFGSLLLLSLRPLLHRVANKHIITYISSNSMWLYLWHIVPVYFVSMLLDRLNLWIVRYLVVLIFAILLNHLYQSIVKVLPESIYKVVK